MLSNILESEKFTKKKLDELREQISMAFKPTDFNKDFLDNICIYACGSMGRGEITQNSDLDLFFINSSDIHISNLDTYLFFSKLYELNKKMGFKNPSKDGAYWHFHSLTDLLNIGSQKEDFNNCFTSRLLLILESTPVFNNNFYSKIVYETIEKYFIEYEKYKRNFLPMYLINDILRYWYTLTLNYEFRRDKNDTKEKKYWKRLKLKYPRLLTCYATIACLFEKNITKEYVKDLFQIPPLKRLDLIAVKNVKLKSIVDKIKIEYDWYLSLTKLDSSWWNHRDNKKQAFLKANNFHELIVHKMVKEVSMTNPDLIKKLDI